MSMLADDSAVMVKTKELCAVIAAEPGYKQLQDAVERFLDDDAARMMYQSVNERGQELHQKQHAGIELSAREISEFEEARGALLDNDLARGFLEAQRQLETVQRSISKYVGLTLELGRVPTPDDFTEAEGGGCCGGGGEGGCGCSH
jgi:cell fate (sporulation/competence/biofilm development) regulator YlbF (YheA/YmcA/DUF963 family)